MQEVPFDIEYKIQTQQLYLVMIHYYFFNDEELNYAVCCSMQYLLISFLFEISEKRCVYLH